MFNPRKDRHVKSTLPLIAAAMVLPVIAAAQERTAGQAMDAQINWAALKNSIDLVSNQNKAIAALLDRMQACNALKMIYAPGNGADANGCISVGGGNVQVGNVTNTSSFTNRRFHVAFPKAFSKVPKVYLALNRYNYHDKCREDQFITSMSATNVTRTGFTLTLSGSGACGGRVRVESATWIAAEQ
jgi:hypothetical protein